MSVIRRKDRSSVTALCTCAKVVLTSGSDMLDVSYTCSPAHFYRNSVFLTWWCVIDCEYRFQGNLYFVNQVVSPRWYWVRPPLHSRVNVLDGKWTPWMIERNVEFEEKDSCWTKLSLDIILCGWRFTLDGGQACSLQLLRYSYWK